MKQFIMFVSAIVACTCSFAVTPESGFSKNSPQLNALGAAWNSHKAVQVQKNNDITIVYGGEDISRRPTINFHSTTA